ncbi:N-acetyltransferase [Allostella vacuolata]|nr:N-acetyltransferase [Stella vacuolata]
MASRLGPGVVSVRRAVAADVPTLVRFSRALSRHEGDPVHHVTEERMLADGFGRRPEFRAWLAELDGRPAGYSLDHDAYSSIYCERGIYLMDLYVEPRARRRGVARALVTAVARAARRRGRTYLWWTSNDGNADAHAFYAGIGARIEAVRLHVLGTAALNALAGRRKTSG